MKSANHINRLDGNECLNQIPHLNQTETTREYFLCSRGLILEAEYEDVIRVILHWSPLWIIDGRDSVVLDCVAAS